MEPGRNARFLKLSSYNQDKDFHGFQDRNVKISESEFAINFCLGCRITLSFLNLFLFFCFSISFFAFKSHTVCNVFFFSLTAHITHYMKIVPELLF